MQPVYVHADRRGKYVQHIGKYDFSSLHLPTPLQAFGPFVLRNNMPSNVYEVDDNEVDDGNEVIYPLRVSSTLVPNWHLDLLLFERDGVQHYTTFSRLVGRQLCNHVHTVDCCRRCLHAYSNQELLDARALDCCHVQRNKFPKDRRCRSTNIQKQLLAPFVVYADFESILQRVGDEAMDTTQGLAAGGDEPTPPAELRSFHTAINSHICSHPLGGDKVRDHCHIVKCYRGTAHSRCNLAYRILKSEWKLPVVIHNLKGYDGHLIVKALKSEFGEARVIPQNMEKYLSITVDRLKFIDSLQFTSQSLDSLVKTFEVDEYVREAFPIAHEFELIKRKGVYPYDYKDSFARFDCLRRMHSSASCLTVRARTWRMHMQLRYGLPVNVSQWQTTTTST